jgi:hypothetical protein
MSTDTKATPQTDERIDAEAELRRWWWLGHGCTSMYGDDGEMQCASGKHPILDFKRMSLASLREEVLACKMRMLAATPPQSGARQPSLKSCHKHGLQWDYGCADCYAAAEATSDAIEAARDRALAGEPEAQSGQGSPLAAEGSAPGERERNLWHYVNKEPVSAPFWSDIVDVLQEIAGQRTEIEKLREELLAAQAASARLKRELEEARTELDRHCDIIAAVWRATGQEMDAPLTARVQDVVASLREQLAKAEAERERATTERDIYRDACNKSMTEGTAIQEFDPYGRMCATIASLRALVQKMREGIEESLKLIRDDAALAAIRRLCALLREIGGES